MAGRCAVGIVQPLEYVSSVTATYNHSLMILHEHSMSKHGRTLLRPYLKFGLTSSKFVPTSNGSFPTAAGNEQPLQLVETR